jgi:hypothetical protein
MFVVADEIYVVSLRLKLPEAVDTEKVRINGINNKCT